MDAAMKEFLGVGESLTFYSLIVDFAIASLFLLIGQWIRAKVRIVQKFFLPASILAGFMGLFLGQALPECPALLRGSVPVQPPT